MSDRSGADSGVTQRQADILGRQFNSALTNTTAYGADHPVTGRTYATFLDSLAPALEHSDGITLMFDRGSLFIEDMPLDGKFNSRRISMIFRALGLQSIRFGRGIDARALERIMAILSSHEQHADIDSVRRALKSDGIESIRVNHVVMRKFSEDEAVISREGLSDLTELAEHAVAPGGGSTGSGGGSAFADDLMQRVEQVFTMRDLVDQPANLSGQVLATSRAGDEGRRSVIKQLRSLRREVTGSGEHDVSMSDVMDALAQVRGELSNALAGQDEIARFLAENGGEVLDEVDQLTYDTVLSIILDEYRGGTTSVKRLAQIMRRIMPDSRDIKRFVPMLKQGLIDAGMPLDEYVRFVNELSEELQSDALISALERGSESVGLSVEEIVGEIRRDPGEAARLLVLAAELRRAGGDES